MERGGEGPPHPGNRPHRQLAKSMAGHASGWRGLCWADREEGFAVEIGEAELREREKKNFGDESRGRKEKNLE